MGQQPAFSLTPAPLSIPKQLCSSQERAQRLRAGPSLSQLGVVGPQEVLAPHPPAFWEDREHGLHYDLVLGWTNVDNLRAGSSLCASVSPELHPRAEGLTRRHGVQEGGQHLLHAQVGYPDGRPLRLRNEGPGGDSPIRSDPRPSAQRGEQAGRHPVSGAPASRHDTDGTQAGRSEERL